MDNRKRLLIFTVTAVLLAGFLASANAATIDDDMFPEKEESIFYSDAENHWAHSYIEMCTRMGLLNGTGKSDSGKALFRPNDRLSLPQAVTIAVRLYQIYHHETPIQSAPTALWYEPYREYALSHGLLNADEDLAPQDTRCFFAELMLRVFPKEEFEAINTIEDIPDVDESTLDGEAVLTLYNAGVLTGVNDTGYFNGDLFLTRAEAAAILCRMVRPEARISFSLNKPSTGEDFQKLSFLAPGDYVVGFDGTYLVVNNASNQYGVYDLTGRLVVPWQNGRIDATADGIFQTIVLSGDADVIGVTYYNEKGDKIGTYYRGTPFYEGMAAGQREKGGPIALFDKDGTVVREYENPHQYQLTITDVLSADILCVSGGERCALLDLKTGTFTLASFSIQGRWSDGLARVLDVETMRYGYMDTTGQEVIPCIYPYGTDFSSGVAAVVDRATSLYGAIDTKGNVVVPFEYTALSQYDAGGHAVGVKEIDGVWQHCLIDSAGKVEKLLPSEGDVSYEPHTPLLYRTYNSQPQLFSSDANPLWVNEFTQAIYVADNGTALVQTYDAGMMQHFLYQSAK